MNIKINNCNCIAHASIQIEKGCLNLKYGLNGTGKTTIGKAINYYISDKKKIENLKPYWVDETEKTSVLIDENINSVKMFDSEYIESFLFQQADDIFTDSFQVLLRNKECDDLLSEIDKRFESLGKDLVSDETLDDILQFVSSLFSVIKLNGDKTISSRGGIAEVFKGNGAGFEKHLELSRYKPFYSRSFADVSRWANWRNSGSSELLEDQNICPYCIEKINKEVIEKENKAISSVFKKSALQTANAIIDYINKAIERGFILTESANKLINLFGSENRANELKASIGFFTNETEYLRSKITDIIQFRPFRIERKDLKELENKLDQLLFDKDYFSKYYLTPTVIAFIDGINGKINELKKETAKLKELFGKYEARINTVINERKKDINEFLFAAGFPYEFEISIDSEKHAKAFLVPSQMQGVPIERIDQHLSWGERNAFALVMFMFETLYENPDLIILDDPITSFDKNKKFAIMKRLFDHRKDSFEGRTVLLLTHDLQPAIDFVYEDMFKRYGCDVTVNAKVLTNQEGDIAEVSIEKSSLINTVELYRRYSEGAEYPLFIRIVSLRKYLELTDSEFIGSSGYDILSSLIHGRKVPLKRTNNTEDYSSIPLTREEIDQGFSQLNHYINESCYDSLHKEISLSSLFSYFKTCNNDYEKLIIIRLMLEQMNGVNGDTISLIKRRYPDFCKYVNESNHIENDYIFQLDPMKYQLIPSCYNDAISFVINQVEELVREGEI